ncbi:MAG: HD-GYP domain-containing protein [Proteobacteria bacterium]|nr:HD-GYP domain-containing protein [Pseudomonadota bacterium]
MKEKSVYLALMGAGTALLAWCSSHVVWSDRTAWLFMATYVAITIPLLFARINLASQLRHYSMEDVAVYAIVFSSGAYASPHWAIGSFVVFTASLLCEVYVLAAAIRHRGWNIRWGRVFYNFSNPFAHVVYLAVAGAAYEHVNAGAPFLASGRNYVAILACVAAYMTFTTAVDTLETLTSGEKVRGLLDIYSSLSLNIAMLAPLGVVLAVLWRANTFAILLLAVPVAVMHVTMRSVRGIVDEAQLAIETMLNTLEERDEYTAGHSERVGRFAAHIAEALGMEDDEIRRVQSAGRIHDIGKIDIPDAILRKTCCLDDHEYGIMKTHTERPMDYATNYPRLGKYVPFYEAACHHEKFNGSGYHHGLQGEQIPIIARIISVADTWDAMTSDRPYRNGLIDAEALSRLTEAAGTQFDPRVVDGFMQAYQAGHITRVMVEWRESERLRKAKNGTLPPPRSPRRRRPTTA